MSRGLPGPMEILFDKPDLIPFFNLSSRLVWSSSTIVAVSVSSGLFELLKTETLVPSFNL